MVTLYSIVGIKPKQKKRKLLIFTTPSKTTLKELKMTFLLVSLVATHIVLTMPSNITFLYWTIYPTVWVSDTLASYLITY